MCGRAFRYLSRVLPDGPPTRGAATSWRVYREAPKGRVNASGRTILDLMVL
jgi:hypothetical protein